MAKCFRCELEIDLAGPAIQFVDHYPVHPGTNACNEALLKNYQKGLEKVEQFIKTQAADEDARVLAAQEAEKVKTKAEQDAAIKKEAEEAENAKHPVQAKQPGPFGGAMNPPFSGAGSNLTPEQQKAKAEAEAKKAEADAEARRLATKKNQEEKDKAEAERKAREQAPHNP